MKKVLFVCVENACRSQMAEGFFNKYAPESIKAISAGAKPQKRVNPQTVKVMAERGVDISKQRPKMLTSDMVKSAEKVILMGCRSNLCPVAPVNVEDWQIEDPKGKSIDKFREIRVIIEAKVKRLMEKMERGRDYV